MDPSQSPADSSQSGIPVLAVRLKLPSSTWVEAEEFRDIYQIAMHIPRGGTRTLPHPALLFLFAFPPFPN